MSKLHVSQLTDDELTAVFRAAASEAVARAKAAGQDIPTMPAEKAASRAPARIVDARRSKVVRPKKLTA